MGVSKHKEAQQICASISVRWEPDGIFAYHNCNRAFAPVGKPICVLSAYNPGTDTWPEGDAPKCFSSKVTSYQVLSCSVQMNVNFHRQSRLHFGVKFAVEDVVCEVDIRTLAGCVHKKLMHTLSEKP